MFESLIGKRVLVTGASTGIGAETAVQFGRQGATVGLHYRQNRALAEAVAGAIRSAGGVVHLIAGDLQDEGVRRRLIAEFADTAGGIDILINNAGACYGYAHFTEIDETSWDQTMSLNAKAPFFLGREAFKYMQAAGWGRIVNISSVAMKYGGACSLHYAASKAALEALTVGFAKAGARHNVLVNSIRCGVIETPMRTTIAGYSEELFKQRVAKIAVGRAGTPADVARMVLFLASDGGNFITGEVFTVAGGD